MADLLLAATDAASTNDRITIQRTPGIGTREGFQVSFESTVAIAETIVSSEAPAVIAFSIKVADSTQVAEVPVVNTTSLRPAVGETLSATDTVALTLASLVVGNETTALSEFATAPFPSPIAALETSTLSERLQMSAVSSFQVFASELIASSEVEGETLVLNVSVSDTATLVPGGPPFAVAVTETTVTSEGFSVQMAVPPGPIAAAEATATSEFVRAQVLNPFQTSNLEAVSTSEFFLVGMPPVIVSTVEVSKAEAVATAEAHTTFRAPVTTFTVSVSDVTATSENPLVIRDVAITERVAMSEAMTFTWLSTLSAAEVVTPQDVPNLQIGVLFTGLDTTATAEHINAALAETAAVVDSTGTSELAAVTVTGPAVVAAESVTATESPTVALIAKFDIDISTETINSDKTTVVAIGITAAVSDAIAVQDQVGQRQEVSVSKAETTGLSEATAFTFSSAIIASSDAIGSNDSVAALMTIPGANIVEPVAVSEGAAVLLESAIMAADATVTGEVPQSEVVAALAPQDLITTAELVQMFLTIDAFAAELASIVELAQDSIDSTVARVETATEVAENIVLFFTDGFQVTVSDSTATAELVYNSIPTRWQPEQPGTVAPSQNPSTAETLVPA